MRVSGSKNKIIIGTVFVLLLLLCGCQSEVKAPEANEILTGYLRSRGNKHYNFSKIDLYDYNGYYYFYTEFTKDSQIETNEFTVLFIFDHWGGWVMNFNPNLDDLLDWKPYYDDYIEAKKLGTYKFYNQEELAEISNLINTPLEN